MNEHSAAEEHLRVIRSLMERATLYRAISAPTALVGGLSALIASAWLLWRESNGAITSALGDNREFILAWFLALAVVVTANTFFLWQGARRGNRSFFSPGLRLALRSIVPSLSVAAFVTAVCLRGPAAVLALVWICLYGLALLSTMNFAPRSLSILGWAFVCAAAVWISFLAFAPVPIEALRGIRGATLAMAFTFGLFHLIYAACTWSRREAEPTQLAPE